MKYKELTNSTTYKISKKYLGDKVSTFTSLIPIKSKGMNDSPANPRLIRGKIGSRNCSEDLMIIKIVVVLCLLVILSGSVLALGVTPGRKIFEYEPGGSKGGTFSVLNTENADMNLVILVEGDMNQSIEVSEVQVRMRPEETSKDFNYVVNMPPGLTPGTKKSEIVVLKLPGKSAEGDTFVGATVGVATQIHVNVPFPGKYAEAELNINGPDENGKVNFVMPVHSKGDLDIVRLRGTVDIYTSLNEKVETLTTAEKALSSNKREELVATWDTSSAQPGPYRAVATIIYDEETINIEKEFVIGKRRLEIAGIEVNDFSLGEIAKFEILVENKWSEVVRDVYAQMEVLNNAGEIMADFKSQNYNIEPLQKMLMVAFWDTGGVKVGTYDASMFLRYGDSSEQNDLKLEVEENNINVIGVGYVISKGSGGSSGESNTLMIVMVVGIVVLVLINLIWFLVLRKKLVRKK